MNSDIELSIEEKRYLLKQLLKEKISKSKVLPLSYAQERIWILSQIHKDDSAYNLHRTFRISGNLNYEILEKSIGKIIERHEILRSTFSSKDGIPFQMVNDYEPYQLKTINFSGKKTDENEIKNIVLSEINHDFDLQKHPLFSVFLICLNENLHLLCFTFHHIISDGWSIKIFYSELSEIYKSLLKNEEAILEELPMQYGSYALQQRKLFATSEKHKQLNYWVEQLRDISRFDLPADYSRNQETKNNGEEISVDLSVELSEKLRNFSKDKGITLFVSMLGSLNVLFYRYTGHEDICIGIPMANRNESRTEKLIGIFLNTLVIRTKPDKKQTFADLLLRLRKTAMEAYDNCDIPFEKLLEELNPERDISRNPVFSVFCNMLNLSSNLLELDNLEIEPYDINKESKAKFDISIYINPQKEKINIKFNYNKDLFCQERIAELLDQYEFVLKQMLENPDQELSKISLITPSARKIIPNPGIELPEKKYKTIPELIERWVKESPDSVAINDQGKTYTFLELASISNRIALLLTSESYKQEKRVAIYGSSGFRLIASILAVMKSGKIFLSLDQELPKSRKEYLLHEAKIGIVMLCENLKEEDSWFSEQFLVVQVDDTIRNPENKCSENKDFEKLPKINGDDAAYIFFTSGSTGKPKGILGKHNSLSHFLVWQRETFAINQNDRFAQLTSLSFDVILRDIFLPLISGASLYISRQEGLSSADEIVSWLESCQITGLHIVPSLLRAWLNNLTIKINLEKIRLVFFAGEPLSSSLINQWKEHGSGLCQFINLYGPTETTLAKSYKIIEDEPLPGIQPIGKSLPDSQILIWKDFDECGIYETGEIVIRTPYNTFGYINHPNDKFLKNPYRNDDKDILYRTGDLGCYQPNGDVKIFGRIDNQFKIRGVRIEAGEIESMLNSIEEIEQTVVIPIKEKDEVCLTAYIKYKKNTSSLSIKRKLRLLLPEYMIPNRFIKIDEIPLLPNGKTDYQYLKNILLPLNEETQSQFKAPFTETEMKVAEIWKDLLKVERIGVYDNFFDLGGHSLLVLNAISKIKQKMNLEVRFVDFMKQTLGQFATMCEEIRK